MLSPKKRHSDGDTVDAADQRVVLPDLNGMGVTLSVKRLINIIDRRVDPGFSPRSAALHNLRKGPIGACRQMAAPQGLAQGFRCVKTIQRQDAAKPGLHPEHVF
jgi:hypothetical protein